MPRFDNVFISQRVRASLGSILDSSRRKKFWTLVESLQFGELSSSGFRLEKLRTNKGKIFSARLSIELRVIFTVYREASSRNLLFLELDHHDDAYNRVERIEHGNFNQDSAEAIALDSYDRCLESEADFGLDEMDSTTPVIATSRFRVPHYLLRDPEKYFLFEKSVDRFLELTDEQRDLLALQDKAFLVQGSAGTGKTTLALFYALNRYEANLTDDVYMFTYQSELACVCRAYKVNLLDEGSLSEEGPSVKVFSYLEFCRAVLIPALDKTKIKWTWIDKEQSLKHLSQIIEGRPRWKRRMNAPELYSIIYSILKGRFVPGTEKLAKDPEDYRRIFKGYGREPLDFEDLLEVFSLYEKRLGQLKQRDEADLIKYCYESLKETAILTSPERALFMVIDEVQDFSELEWKSILLFWENHCLESRKEGKVRHFGLPFLGGDRAQNISRSGFRFQDLESYLESTLKKIGKENSLHKVVLHQNFRNTREIHYLAQAIRRWQSDSSAYIGLAPEATGPRPLLVVGNEANFTKSLQNVLAGPSSSTIHPLPVLIEGLERPIMERLSRASSEEDSPFFFLSLNKAKGLEFEDLILYGLFSTLADVQDFAEAMEKRLIDLWYMAVTRARKRLLIYVHEEDWQKVQSLVKEDFPFFLEQIDLVQENQVSVLERFFLEREQSLPNYSVVFLEKRKADESWERFKEMQGQNLGTVESRNQYLAKALKLWRRCRDFSSLGNALFEQENFSEAYEYLICVGNFEKAAICAFRLGDYDKAADLFLKSAKLLDAARALELTGKFAQAAALYVQMENWTLAAESSANAGQWILAAEYCQKAGMWTSAAELYRRKNKWIKAAESYLEAEQFSLAAEMYLKGKDRLDAARSFQKAQEFKKAGDTFFSLNRFDEAGQCFRNCGDFARAADCFSKSGKAREAAQMYVAASLWIKAADTYKRLRDWLNAGIAFEKAGKIKETIECFELAEAWTELSRYSEQLKGSRLSARLFEAQGDLKSAAAEYLASNAAGEAAYCFERLENWSEAADNYLKGNNQSAAAYCLGKMGRSMDAAKLYILCGQTGRAIELVAPTTIKPISRRKEMIDELLQWTKDSGHLTALAQIYENEGQFIEAATIYEQLSSFSQAAGCKERVGQYFQAAILYKRYGDNLKAAQNFKKAQLFDQAGAEYELCQKWQEAKKMYEQAGNAEAVKRCANAAKWF